MGLSSYLETKMSNNTVVCGVDYDLIGDTKPPRSGF